MISDSKVAINIDEKQGAKGSYWTITWDDDKVDNVFKSEWAAIAEQSIGEAISFTKEKAANSKYYNIQSFSIGTPKPKTPAAVATPAPRAPTIVREDDSKVRSMAVSYAKDLAVAGKIELKELSTYANKFVDYILNKEVTPNRLVEAAKKMGATEI
jgi:hypothetical protein